MLRNLKHILTIVVLTLAILFGVQYLLSDEFTNDINSFFTYRTGGDVWQDRIYRHTLRPSKDIVIIKIDNKTLNSLQAKGNLKTLSIPKAHYITLIEKLQKAKVKGIGFDIIFENADKDEESFALTLQKYKNIVIATEDMGDLCTKRLDYFINVERTKVQDDMRVRTKIATGEYIEVGTILDEARCPEVYYQLVRSHTGLLTESEKRQFAPILSLKSWNPSYTTTLLCEKDASGSTLNCSGSPRSVYKGSTWGLVKMDEIDGISRIKEHDIGSVAYLSWKTGTGKVKSQDLLLETLPYALYKVSEKIIPTTTSLNGIIFPGPINLRDDSTLGKLNPYFGGPGSYASMSFVDALEMGTTSAMLTFSGKYVLIGESGTAIHDSILSPVTGTAMDGVESHAHYLDGILQDEMLARMLPSLQTGLIIFFAVVSILIFYIFPFILSLICALMIPIGILYLARFGYDVERTLVDIFPLFLSGSILTFPLTYIYRFFIVDREKRQLKTNFAHYIDPHVVDQIVKKGDSIELGGERKTLSVLFSDIAGFTTISEKLDPRDLFYLMTAYLSRMTRVLITEGGTLDKYIGDAVMGFFGAPLPYEDHAIRAATTALKMRDELPDFNEEIQKHGIDPINFRVGIASGEVLVGNIGSHDRFNYTVLGDTVNLASRLEGAGKEYGVQIILSSKTKELLSPRFFCRELDTLAVKGKTEGVRIYELVGYSEDYVDRLIYINYEKALRLYRSDQYREAGQIWQSQAAIDPPSKVMMLRCVEVLKGNIKIINGVYSMDHK